MDGSKCSFCLLISFVMFFSEGTFSFGFSPIKCMLKTKKHNQGTKESKKKINRNMYLSRSDTHALTQDYI